MRAVRTLVLVAVTALLAAPASQALVNPEPEVSTPQTLYFHIFDTFNKFVINTQPMDADFFDVGGTNFPTLVDTPINDGGAGQNGFGDWDLNTIYGYSTAGPVEYDFIESGKPRFHPEPGIARDVIFDESVQPVAYMYIDVRDIRGANTLPNVMPFFHMEFTMRTGDDPGDTDKLDAGNLIMHGSTKFHLADGHSAPLNPVFSQFPAPDRPVLTPDENGIVEVQIPVTFDAGKIPKSDAFNIRIDWWQEPDPTGTFIGPDQFAEGFLRLFSSPDYLPRLELNIMNPIYIEFIHPQVAAGTLLIHAGVNSPWGTYDVDTQTIDITIDGPSAPENLEQVVAANTHVHGLHDKAAEITYLWKFRDEGAELGEYTINFGVSNLAGGFHEVLDANGNVTYDENGKPVRGERFHPESVAWAHDEAGFVIEKEKAFGVDQEGNVVEPTVVEDTGTPGFGAAMLLLALAGVAIARRRD